MLTSAQALMKVMQPVCLRFTFVNPNIRVIGLRQVSAEFQRCADEGGVNEGGGENSCRHTEGVAKSEPR